jgi:hypothetical protein
MTGEKMETRRVIGCRRRELSLRHLCMVYSITRDISGHHLPITSNSPGQRCPSQHSRPDAPHGDQTSPLPSHKKANRHHGRRMKRRNHRRRKKREHRWESTSKYGRPGMQDGACSFARRLNLYGKVRLFFSHPTGADEGVGTTILETTPTSAVLSTSALDEYCSTCFLGTHELSVQRTASAHGAAVDVPKLALCGGCQVTRYCSKVRPVPLHPLKALLTFHGVTEMSIRRMAISSVRVPCAATPERDIHGPSGAESGGRETVDPGGSGQGARACLLGETSAALAGTRGGTAIRESRARA